MDGKTDSLAVLLRYPVNDSLDAFADFKPKRKVEINAPTARIDKNELRFALIGAGNLARWEHLPALQKIPNTKLQAVYSARGAKGKGYGIRFNAEYTTSDYQEILNDKEIDVVLVASRHRDHAPETVAALNSGKHVFVEKPMAITAQECREIVSAVRQSGKQVTVGFNRRFAPYYAEMKSQLAKRTGEAVINIRMNASYMNSDFWGATMEEGGAIIGEAVHMVDLMRFFLNSDPVSVSAYSLPTGKSEPIGENNIVASFKFEDGSIGNLTYCTVGSDSSAGELVEFYAPGIGASSEDFKQLVVKKGSTRKKQSKVWAAKGYEAQMQSFVRCLREGREPEITVLDGAKAFLGCLLMLESARNEGAPQPFDIERVLPD
jgi:predicted dehydrogenase